jgi:uncharacterized protein YhaN
VRDTQLGLERYDDKQSAADAAVEAEALLAKIRTGAERWARVRAAWHVLHNAVEKYRATHQAPLLARTNQIFPRLTLGGYAELRVDHDAEPPVLIAVEQREPSTGALAPSRSRTSAMAPATSSTWRCASPASSTTRR